MVEGGDLGAADPRLAVEHGGSGRLRRRCRVRA